MGIWVYWVIISAGMVLSAVLFVRETQGAGVPAWQAALGWVAGAGTGVLCAKAMYVLLFCWIAAGDFSASRWLSLMPEEFSFAAGCAGFCLGPVIVCRKHIPDLTDRLIVPGCVLAAVLRFGESVLAASQVSYVGVTDIFRFRTGEGFLNFFPLTVPFSRKYSFLCVCTVAAALILLVILHLKLHRRGRGRPEPKGMLFERGALLLCCVRLFLETTGMKAKFYFVFVDQALCGIFILALIIRMGTRLKKYAHRFPKWTLVFAVLMMAINGVTQFLMDKPGKLEKLLPEGVYLWVNDNMQALGYAVLFVTAALIAAAGLRLLKRTMKAIPRYSR